MLSILGSLLFAAIANITMSKPSNTIKDCNNINRQQKCTEDTSVSIIILPKL